MTQNYFVCSGWGDQHILVFVLKKKNGAFFPSTYKTKQIAIEFETDRTGSTYLMTIHLANLLTVLNEWSAPRSSDLCSMISDYDLPC